MADIHTIASIALETGISKEVLRKWEERYGFPTPQRDACGHRSYPAQQGVRLKLIKRLIDAGMRPSQVVPLDEQSLASLLQPKLRPAASDDADTAVVAEMMAMLRCRERYALTQKLRQQVRQLGLEKFVLEVVCALNMAVGQAWERGEIGIRDEHMYTEVLQNLIREELSLAQQPDGLPRILLTTPPGELHTLGLLMVEAIAMFHGAYGISLGAQTPLEEIAHAAGDYHADIVCLCFSAVFPKRKIVPFLKTLRGMVPPAVEIWVGGAGVGALDSTPRGIRIMTALGQLGDAIGKYRRERKVRTVN